jgi:hypothetical protein
VRIDALAGWALHPQEPHGGVQMLDTKSTAHNHEDRILSNQSGGE